ncbi:MAG: hypothetical protein RIS34_618 [Pseudomonadota bacterium]
MSTGGFGLPLIGLVMVIISCMNRRHFILTQFGLFTGVAMADTPKVQSLDDALRWLDRLEKATHVKSTTAWKMEAVFEHLAQSIEMSLDGFPQPKSALFQNTVGAAAFAMFKWRGKMSHGLTDPIPGAPELVQSDNWKPGAQRLRDAITRFNGHTGPVKPHFAYGVVSRRDFALAHALHIANHQDEILVG